MSHEPTGAVIGIERGVRTALVTWAGQEYRSRGSATGGPPSTPPGSGGWHASTKDHVTGEDPPGHGGDHRGGHGPAERPGREDLRPASCPHRRPSQLGDLRVRPDACASGRTTVTGITAP